MQIQANNREEIEAKTGLSEDILRNDNSGCERNDDEDSSWQPYSPASMPLPNLYVCVYCATPCSTLYRKLNKNSLSSIKAMHCERCHRIVDPYVEREWLLVAIDCILMRPEAYRHILYNNQDLSKYIHIQKNEEYCPKQEKENLVAAATTSTPSRIQHLIQLAQWTLISSLFHAYLKLKSLAQTRQQHLAMVGAKIPSIVLANDNSSTMLHVTFIVTSALDLVAQWLAIYGFIELISSESKPKSIITTSTTTQKYDGNDAKQVSMIPSHSIAYQIYLALLLPTSFHIISVVVLLWENSKTTRAFGSLLVACWQCLGIFLLSMNNDSKTSAKKSFLKGCTPLVGIISLIAWRFAIDQFLLTMVYTTRKINLKQIHPMIPCVGYEMDVVGDIINAIAYDETRSNVGWASTSLLLCLT